MKKILIVGAGFLQDFVIRRAKKLGYYTIAIDGNPEAVGLKHADKGAVINIVDAESSLRFAKKENIDGVTELIIDFEQLEYISSAGLRVLLSAQKTMSKQGTMKVIHVSDLIKEIFEVTGFIDILTIE